MSEIHTDRDGRALQGHDVVAYFTLGKQVEGDPAISHDWNGATWLFSTEGHKAAFVDDPEAYAPAFGGHCAVAGSMGMQLPGSPKRWRIDDGRLYINKNLMAAAGFPLLAGRIRRAAEAGHGDR